MKSRSVTIGMLVFLFVTGAAEALALPDAVLRGLAAGGADLEGGERVPIAVTLANQGNSPLASVPVVLRIDDSPLAEWQPPQALAPGESAEWVFTWTAVRGSHIILAQVDPLNDVAESDETNNAAFLSLGAAAEPEPSPWPALLVGFASLVVGLVLGLRVQSRRRRQPSPSRFQRPRESREKRG